MIIKNIQTNIGLFKKDDKLYCGYCCQPINEDDKSCPRCKSTFYTSPYKIKDYNFKNKHVYVTGHQIFENDNKSLTLKIYEKKIVLDKQNKFRISNYVYPFHFRFDKGQIYELPILNGQTFKILRKKNNVIRNISYSPYKLNYLLDDLHENNLKHIIDTFVNHTKKYFAKYDNDKNLIQTNINQIYSTTTDEQIRTFGKDSLWDITGPIIFSLTKYHTIDYGKINFFKYSSNIRTQHISTYKYLTLRKLWFHDNYFQQVEHIMHIKLCKQFKKLFSENFFMFLNNYKIGLLKLDTQQKIYKLLQTDFNQHSTFTYQETLNIIYDFISLFNDENIGCKRCVKLLKINQNFTMSYAYTINSYIFKDTIRMLKIIKNNNIKIKKYLKLKSLSEIHDSLAKIVTELSSKNCQINHTNFELTLNSEIEYKNRKIYIQLCNQTRELTNIGRTMNNCVASYKNSVLEKECSILYAYENNKLISCIELRDKTLYQVKDYNNRRLPQEYQEIIKAWAHTNRLQLKYCYDIDSNTKLINNILITKKLHPLESLGQKPIIDKTKNRLVFNEQRVAPIVELSW